LALVQQVPAIAEADDDADILRELSPLFSAEKVTGASLLAILLSVGIALTSVGDTIAERDFCAIVVSDRSN
jgi:RNA-binding protein YlmH